MTAPVKLKKTCNWFETTGRFMYGLDGVRPYEFFQTVSGYSLVLSLFVFDSNQNHPIIYQHSDGIEILGKDKNGKPFQAICKDVSDAAKLWKETFDESNISKRTDDQIAKMDEVFGYFSGYSGNGAEMPTIYSVKGRIFIMGIDEKHEESEPFKEECKSIDEAAKIWRARINRFEKFDFDRCFRNIMRAISGKPPLGRPKKSKKKN